MKEHCRACALEGRPEVPATHQLTWGGGDRTYLCTPHVKAVSETATMIGANFEVEGIQA